MMRILVITGEAFRPSEAEEIRLLLDEGAERIHLRKPQAAEESMRRLIESLPQRLYPRLTLHDHLPLAVEYGLGGVHLNSRSRRVPDGFRGVVSCSCHTLEELALHPEADYCFLSPIFDSISKSGYRAAFTLQQLRRAATEGLLTRRVVALGGIRPEHLPELHACGFGGVALLGFIWRDATPAALRERMKKIDEFNTL